MPPTIHRVISFLAITVLIGVYLAQAQNQTAIPAEFKPTIEQKFDARSSPAKVTSDEESALTTKGYVQIGTISASKPGKKEDPDITRQLEAAILQKAAEAGGDVVRLTKEGALETTEVGTAKYKAVKSLVSEGTVWRYDPQLAAKATANADATLERLEKLAAQGVAKDSRKNTDDAMKEAMDDMRAIASVSLEPSQQPPATAAPPEAQDATRKPDATAATSVASAPLLPSKEAVESLHRALANGDHAGAESLLANDADINAKDTQGGTLLLYAVGSGYTDVAEVLLAHGADVNVKEEIGQTPLHIAACGRNKELVELLLAHGADVNAKDNVGSTPLSLAAYFKNRDIVNLLRQHGARK